MGARAFSPDTLATASDAIAAQIEVAVNDKQTGELERLFLAKREIAAAIERKPSATAPKVGRPKGSRNKTQKPLPAVPFHQDDDDVVGGEF